ncbi:MAG: hypothetical protein WBP81_35710 [Solirubrobacteraceae bacterium]
MDDLGAVIVGGLTGAPDPIVYAGAILASSAVTCDAAGLAALRDDAASRRWSC